jgi:hypothetical protein
MNPGRPSRGRQGVEKPRMGRRNRSLRGLYRVAPLGRRGRPPLGGQSHGAPEQDRGGIAAAEPLRERRRSVRGVFSQACKRVVDLFDNERPASAGLARHAHCAAEQKHGARQDKSERREVGQVEAEMLKADKEARSHEKNNSGI